MHNAQWCLSLSLPHSAAQSRDLFKCYPVCFTRDVPHIKYVTEDCLLWDVCVQVCTCYLFWEQSIHRILTELSIVVLADVRNRMLCRDCCIQSICTLFPCT